MMMMMMVMMMMMMTRLYRHHGQTQEGGQTHAPAAEASQRCDFQCLQRQQISFKKASKNC